MKAMKVYSLLVICMLATMLAACGKKEEVTEVEAQTEEVNMFGLTQEEQKMYAEYAAGVLMKYNAGSNNRVLTGQKLVQVEAKEKAQREQAAKREQLAAEYEASNKENTSSHGSSSVADSSGGSGMSSVSDMSQATGTDAFSIIYDGYEITDSYPNSREDILMAMDATTGKLLLVTKYKITNNSNQTETLDMFSKQGKFKLSFNGNSYRSQYTLLLDDLSMYRGEIEAGETISGVLIFEIPESEASNVGEMVLYITIDGKTNSMQLYGGSATWTEEAEVVETQEMESSDETAEDDVEENDVEENAEDSEEANDLAQEYMDALEALESGTNNEETENSSNGNVTVVGSNRN